MPKLTYSILLFLMRLRAVAAGLTVNMLRFFGCAIVCCMLCGSKMMVGFPDSTNANDFGTPKTESNKDIVTIHSTIMSTKKTSVMDRLLMVENPLNKAPPITAKIELLSGFSS